MPFLLQLSFYPDDGEEKVNNIATQFNLEEYFASKKDMMMVFKDKIAEVKEKLADKPDRLKEWAAGGAVATFVKSKIFSNFDNCRFWMGKSYGNDEPVESFPIVSMWVDDSHTGETFFFFKDCLKEVKV